MKRWDVRITLEIRFASRWLRLDDGCVFVHLFVHLEVESIAPKRAPLPITGTGHRSHFTAEAEIAHWGNPEGFVLAWLADAAKAKAWTPVEATGQQLSPF